MTDNKVIVIFRNERFGTPWPEGSVDAAEPWGRDCAEYFLRELRNLGAFPTFAEPIQGDEGWVVDAKVGDQEFSLFFNWAPIGDPPQTFWAVQPSTRRGVIATLLGRRKSPDDLSPILEKVNAIVDRDDFEDVRWLSQQELAALY